jgi:hypothetical protein
MKQTWKLNSMDEVAAAIATTPSLRQAAAKLGVNVSTVSRLVKAGRVSGRQARLPRSTTAPPRNDAPHTPTEWAAVVRTTFELSATEDQIVTLAGEALTIAQSVEARPSDRLHAMQRFASLVKQLRLPQEYPQDGDVYAPVPFPRRA